MINKFIRILNKMGDGLKSFSTAHRFNSTHINPDESQNIVDEKYEVENKDALSYPRRKMAMFLGVELSPTIMRYVMRTCKKLRFDLVILTSESLSQAKKQLEPYNDELKNLNIGWSIVKLKNNPRIDIAKYLKRHADVTVFVCKESGYLSHAFLIGEETKISLPVIMIAEPE